MNLFSLNCVSESLFYFLSICSILFCIQFDNSFHNWFYNLFYLFVWVGNLFQLFFKLTTNLELRNDLIDKLIINNRWVFHRKLKRWSRHINLVGTTRRPHLYVLNIRSFKNDRNLSFITFKVFIKFVCLIETVWNMIENLYWGKKSFYTLWSKIAFKFLIFQNIFLINDRKLIRNSYL